MYDPVVAEATRYLLTFDDARATLEGLREVNASLAKLELAIKTAAEETNRGAAAISTAVQRAVTTPEWEQLVKEISEAVHFNGYVALERLVDSALADSVGKISNLLDAAGATVDLRMRNLEAAVAGKPPIPILAAAPTLWERVCYTTVSACARFRGWCIYAMPTLVLSSTVFLFFSTIFLADLAVTARH
jgi:hypothetical protein